MKTLKEQIEQAQTSEELEQVISNIPKQDNGHRTQLYRVLDDSFWYIDLNTVEKQKRFMLERVDFYK